MSTAKPPAFIFDVDGTLCDVRGVRHYLLDDPRRKDFEHFHAGAALCPPHHSVVTLAHAMVAIGVTPLVVTARKEKWRYLTSTWLQKWNVPHEHLMMRPNADARRDYLVKKVILARIRTRYEVLGAVDDNPAVIALWEEEQLPLVVTVPGWVEERPAAAARPAT